MKLPGRQVARRLLVVLGALAGLVAADFAAEAANPFSLHFRRPESQPPQPEPPPAVVTPAPPPAQYGAIAVSGKSLSWGSAWNYTSLAEAEAAALSRCRKYARDCKIAVSGSNSCQSLATGRNGWGSGRGGSQSIADNSALGWCRKYTKSCKVTKASFCTGI